MCTGFHELKPHTAVPAATCVAALMCGMRPRLNRSLVVLCASVVLVAALARPASAKSYSAERFDSVVRVLADGSLDVTETVVFRFTDGTFKEVFREVPVRRTDGVEVIRAEMEGQLLPFGSELGTVDVRQRNGRVRVVWRFRPVENVTRTFLLNYRMRGVVRQEADADVLVWRATPSDHAYAIDSSTVRFDLPVEPQRAPGVTTRKTGPYELSSRGTVVEIATSNIAANGWIDAGFRFPARTVASAAPRWQQRASDIDAGAPKWLMAAAVVFAVGLVLLIAWRQSYDAPPPHQHASSSGFQQPPDDLRPALSGALATNGRPALEHAMATLFSLADRGAIQIEEEPRGVFGTRTFEVTRTGAVRVSGDEEQVLDAIFNPRSGAVQKVTLSQARSRLVRRWRRVSAAIQAELQAAGFISADRRALRRRYTICGLVLLGVAGVALLAAVPFVNDNGPWPLFIAAALFLLAFMAFIMGATITPLSNEGARRGHLWRDYRKYLRHVSTGAQPAMGLAQNRVLPYAVALGLASAWAKYIKTQPHATPAWFRALASNQDPGAFVAFVATGGAGASSGGHGAGAGAGAGAAGGGASGAG